MTEADDTKLLRETFDLARHALQKGHRPFGSIVVNEEGEILVRAISTQTTFGDLTSHAEMNAVRRAQSLASRAILGKSTIYSSSEPCAMCAAAIFYCGIGRIVFGFGEQNLRTLRNRFSETAGIAMGCREVLAKARRNVSVVGPLLEDEASQLHTEFWTRVSNGRMVAAPNLRHVPDQRADKDDAYLRAAIRLAKQAREDGELPFGAIVVGEAGEVLAEAVSTELSEKDWTCHAETNAVRRAGTSQNYEKLTKATIYASTEPCVMCATGIFYSGIKRIVFGFPEARLRKLLAGETEGLGFSCYEVLSRAAQPVEILGPVLEQEAAEAHSNFWNSR